MSSPSPTAEFDRMGDPFGPLVEMLEDVIAEEPDEAAIAEEETRG